MADTKQRLAAAVNAQDAEALAALLDGDADLAAAINEPIGHFGARALHMATHHRPTLDVLLDHGADPDLPSDWSEGPFTVLDGCDDATARHLISRGATLTPHAAARLGWVDELSDLLHDDPYGVNDRGGDGKRPLHWAGTIEVVDLLLEAGSDIDARCLDHLSTPLQYAAKDQPDVAKLLLDRGATPDIFATAFLGDLDRTRRQLDENPNVIRHRIGRDGYNRVPSCTIYRWTLGYGKSALDLAADHPAVRALLADRADGKIRFVAAAVRGDRQAALAGDRPTLDADDHALLGDAVMRGDVEAVRLMLELGFDPMASCPALDRGTALHVAAWTGKPDIVRLLIEDGRVPVETRDPTHGSTVLGWTCHGAVNCDRHNPAYVEVVRVLLDAGAKVGTPANSDEMTMHQQAEGRPDVQAVLADYDAGP